VKLETFSRVHYNFNKYYCQPTRHPSDFRISPSRDECLPRSKVHTNHHRIAQQTQSSYIDSARVLGVSAIFPLATLNYMLLRWQKAELQETTLSDSDYSEEEEDDDGDGEPAVEYTTHKQYELYVP